jgi:hypothetical protein
MTGRICILSFRPSGEAGDPSLHCTIPTEGGPSLRFSQVGADAAGATGVRSTLPVVCAVVVPALRKVREGRGTHSVGDISAISEIKSLGHPPNYKF